MSILQPITFMGQSGWRIDVSVEYFVLYHNSFIQFIDFLRQPFNFGIISLCKQKYFTLTTVDYYQLKNEGKLYHIHNIG